MHLKVLIARQGWRMKIALVFTWAPAGQPPVARKRHRPPTVRRESFLATMGNGDGGPVKSSLPKAVIRPF